ncbi:hypothetical protein DUI87_19029 [Hirundo rustica rustica]|uniref:ribonuclease H n=1 Tax=Hirundo rustica rustica TaxID=333673 RepID=A0A3M0JZ92_HIRRU|nr:hypothetical protein DUI87_19029 [Hirundo rustica rustica]
MRRGLTELIEQPASDSGGLLKECLSEFNTPILPVRKHDGSYRIVQDLRAVNKITEDLYPVVANPYTLLTCLTPELTWFTVLDLKDAFFCLPIHEDSQKIFAFEWEKPQSGRKSQLTWSVLPQGFKNSPTLFGEQLAKDLESWEAPPEEGKLLQYVDDILIATRTKEACVAWTVSLLNSWDYRVQGIKEKGPGCEAKVSAVLEVKGGHWLSPQRFLKYQAIMVEQDDVEIVVTNIINPASFLSGSQGEPVHHDCLETIEASYSSRPDLKDTPLDDAETWFTDGSSYIISGKRHAGYAVTTCRKVVESGPLPTDTSAQKAEIIALTRALEIAKGKKVNVYTDSRYAFGVVHAHGAIWKERGLLNSQGKNIKHSQEILQLLEAVQLPEQVAIMHIKAHQKVSSELEEGNELADREAKEAAKGEITIVGALIPDGQVSLEVREGNEGTFPIEIRKIVWDNASNLERKLQSWWTLVNFTYDPTTKIATTFVLTVRNATIYNIHPIIALGLNHEKTVLYPSEHRAWARIMNEKWQTVNLESCVTREQQGFICETNMIDAQDICLDTEQNICHFEIHPDTSQKTMLVYIGLGCVKTLNDAQKLVGVINWLRLYLGLTTTQLPPLFDLLKGDSDLKSPHSLTPEACKVLKEVQQAVSARQVYRIDPSVDVTVFNTTPDLHPTGIIGQWNEKWSDSLHALEWVFLPHQLQKTATALFELITRLIIKCWQQCLQLMGADPAKIILPVQQEDFDWSFANNIYLQSALENFSGQIAYHLPSHKLLHVAKFTEISLRPKNSQEPVQGPTVFTDD